MTALRTVSTFLRPYMKQLTIGPACKLMEAILELIVPMLMSRLIDEGVVGGDSSAIARYGILCASCVALGLALAIVCQHSASIASQGYGTDMRNALLAHMQRFSFAQIDRFGTSTLTNRLTADVNQLQFAVAMLIRLVIRAPFLCIGALVMALFLNAPMALILVAVIVVFSALLYAIMARVVPLQRDVQGRLDRVAVILRENLSSARVIRAFDRAADEGARFATANRAHADAAQRVGRLTLLINPVTGLLMNAAILALLYFGGVRLSHGGMTTGEIVAFLNYIASILTAMVVVANLVLTFSRAYASAGRVAEVLEMEPSLEGTGDAAVPPTGASHERAAERTGLAIAFDDVGYAYTPTGAPALQGITFDVRPGETIGIIGGTGSGKSTLVQLIPRLIEATQGVVTIAGRPVADWDPAELRGSIGIVLQKPAIFSGTVADNLRLGKRDATLEQMRAAAEAAQALSFIEAMDGGFDARLEAGGTNLSGGQRQRLSIARALVRMPRLLILDDASSALDFLTESKLRTALRERLPDATKVIVSQRAGSLRDADRIIVLDEGRAVGVGTHAQLLEACALYREIVETQEGRRAI